MTPQEKLVAGSLMIGCRVRSVEEATRPRAIGFGWKDISEGEVGRIVAAVLTGGDFVAYHIDFSGFLLLIQEGQFEVIE